MAKKPEPKIIHPVDMLQSLEAFKNDANNLATAVRHALSFLEDKEIDQAKALPILIPTLREASDKFARWNSVED